jgi:Zn-dependent peptidase ImmA (M78 family)/transcriptional regulator with XRE-family HTH domain
MTSRVEALARPELLEWARKASGFEASEVAKKVPVSVERLESWESGTSRPTINQLRTLANVYKRPIAVFYLPEVPRTWRRPHDFRRIADQFAMAESPDLRIEMRRALLRRRAALDLLDLEDSTPPALGLTIKLGQQPEEAGKELRAMLDVGIETQKGWRDQYEAWNGWRDAVERAGILVTQLEGIEPGEASGVSFSERPLPVIAVNAKDPVRRRVFTLFHEIAHVLLNESGLCDLDDYSGHGDGDGDVRVERFCNAVAGCALLPRGSLLQHPIVKAHDDKETAWGQGDLEELSALFGVSVEAILRRLLDLGMTTWDFYGTKSDELRKAAKDRRGRSSGPPNRPAIAVANSGQTVTRLVMDGLKKKRITASDASDYLNVQVKHFPKIRERLQNRQD